MDQGKELSDRSSSRFFFVISLLLFAGVIANLCLRFYDLVTFRSGGEYGGYRELGEFAWALLIIAPVGITFSSLMCGSALSQVKAARSLLVVELIALVLVALLAVLFLLEI